MTRMRRLLGRAARDERGSLPMAMLIMLVGAVLAMLLIPLVLTQTKVTTFDTGRVRALDAAEAGLDVALGQVRSATTTDSTGTIEGDTAALPCGPLSGTVDQTGGADYTVTLAYYTADPKGHDTTWLASNAMTCVAGYGTHAGTPPDDIYTPSFVLVTSTGSIGGTTPAKRTLSGTYVVQTTNTNIAGGFIRIFPASGATTNYCMDAGVQAQWKVGQPIVLQPCPTGGADVPAEQSWAYNPNLTIQLTATIGDLTLNPSGQGLCLGTTAGASQYAGQALTLQYCPNDPGQAPPPQPAYQLMWSIDDSSNLVDSNTAGNGLGSLRIYVANQTSGQPLQLSSGSGGVTDPHYTWVPSPAVGAGQAGAPNKQLVNYAQFGRCLDVTNQSTAGPPNAAGGNFLILYSCKQNPDPTAVAWNQKFTASPTLSGAAPQTVEWQTFPGSGTYCLTTENSYSPSYVHVQPCASKGTTLWNQQQWTVYQTQTATGAELPYKQKYTMVDYTGQCLSPGPSTDLYNTQYYKAVATACDGSTLQKWNADPNLSIPQLTNLHEIVPAP